MLCQFTFENFKSYKNETILDLQAVSGQNFQDSLLSNTADKNKFLPVSVIYGPNSGGKSNVLDAINCIVSLVMKPILIFKNNTHQNAAMELTPFLFDEDSRNKLTKFELYFRPNDEYEYRYFITITKGIIDKECLILIEIAGIGQGFNTLTLLEKAQNIVSNSPIEYKHVWLVYDKDDFPRDDFDNTYYKCKSLSKQHEAVMYHALWSNECIEYWFILHFHLLQSAISRNDYYPELSEYLSSKYEKNRDDIYSLLKLHLTTAIKNAKQVVAGNKNLPPSQSMPVSVIKSGSAPCIALHEGAAVNPFAFSYVKQFVQPSSCSNSAMTSTVSVFLVISARIFSSESDNVN